MIGVYEKYLLVSDGESSLQNLYLRQRLAQIYSFFDEKLFLENVEEGWQFQGKEHIYFMHKATGNLYQVFS